MTALAGGQGCCEEDGDLMGLQGEAIKPREIEWYLWGLAFTTSLAALEVRALRSKNRYATATSVVRKHTQRSMASKAASTVLIAGAALWWTNHVVWAELDK